MTKTQSQLRELNRGFGAADEQPPRPPRHRHERRSEALTEAASSQTAVPVYYDVPMLKRSPWKWEIAGYFFCGGLSGASYLLSRLACRMGRHRLRPVTRIGTAVAALSVIPCAPLLIKDLGDMSRFHHMLRVFKPESPMNLGTWTMTTYSGAAALALLRELLCDDDLQPAARGRLQAAVRRANPVLVAVIDGAGVPAALLMTSYTGVLLSCTATPIWTRNAWLSPLFVASAMTTGAAAIQMGLACCPRDDNTAASQRVLEKVSLAARATEAITLTAYLNSLGELSKPLTGGRQSHHTWLAFTALVAPEVIQYVLPGKSSRWKLAAAAGITLFGGLSLRQGIINAGNESADDPDAARHVSGTQGPT